jgi:hypothetical protein
MVALIHGKVAMLGQRFERAAPETHLPTHHNEAIFLHVAQA